MPVSTASATIATTDASRLIKRLCTHWAHKLEVEFDATQARIAFDAHTVARLSAGASALEARIEAPDEARLRRYQDVVANHLHRMARGETLEIGWQPGTRAD
ncbi:MULTISPECIES: DUF2218 domain-containing protein [unclassified Luteimonas]|uniref:DUF2218 domain-containing protein n=1 Tax=unclassified Luteimonas TaxID=2629088 RepID=UPI0018F090CE|nr:MULTISPECIES: DUF2218 domain-containing protein [unclassified Luteimonas]MBJ6979540.1 DUF2218 domain-containing protein [Luteimonas sp. MC1895]MBJ6983174.1 DUF2218 domain-containing protein [Luteimonas sp. MC1750]QQO05124.1 DUF2218 domain-containing protein [Luteimonas sp. MC1750]